MITMPQNTECPPILSSLGFLSVYEFQLKKIKDDTMLYDSIDSNF